MKNLISVIPAVLLLLLISVNPVSAQAAGKTDAPYETMNLKFILDSESPPQAVGFDNPTSFWRFRYELRFQNGEVKSAYFAEKTGESPAERTKRIRANNKAYDKAWKKNGVLVGKGRIAKTPLDSPANREINIPVKLPPEIIDVLAKATNSLENPYFRISVNLKVSTKTASNLKFKQKTASSFVCPTKMTSGNVQYWMMNTCGVAVGILKNEEGKIVFSSSSRL